MFILERWLMHRNRYLVYPSRSIQTDGIKAGLLKSFGFGQVGGEALIIHPDYLIAALEPSQRDSYKALNDVRRGRAYRKFNDMFVDRTNPLVQLKEGPPYTPEIEAPMLLNPLARAAEDGKGSYAFTSKTLPTSLPKNANAAIAAKLAGDLAAATGGKGGVGTDVELISSIPVDSATFIERNFTEAEIAYCKASADPRASFAGRWCAKEATFKALGVPSKGAAAAMRDIEVVATEAGPTIKLHGEAAVAAQAKGLSEFKVSLSHSEDVAMAITITS
jgi:phosphopantetheine--protein transferase-like protein